MKTCVVIVASILFISTGGMAFAQVPVTECGQIVEGEGYLTGDLDCSAFEPEHPSGAAIVLSGSGTSLDLRGFTLTGALSGVQCFRACIKDTLFNLCPARCTVFDSVGGGVISGSDGEGVGGDSVTVRDITISDNGDAGIGANRRVVVHNATLSGNAVGVDVGVRGRGSARVYDSVITGNMRFGVSSRRRISLRNSTVTGNGLIPGCTPQTGGSRDRCADLSSSMSPRLSNSTCETSTGKPYWSAGWDWGVCSLD